MNLNNYAIRGDSQHCVVVQLLGGLGNQLFQVAAGLEKCEESQVVQIDSRFGNPRVNYLGKPEVLSFDLPSIKELPPKKSTQFMLWIGNKVHGFAIRSIGRKRIIIRWLTQIACALMSYSWFGKYLPTFIPSDLGWDKRFEDFSKGYILGYCQSYRYSINAITRMKKLQLKNPSLNFLSLQDEMFKSSPLVIHVRRGDYKQEENFGVLSLDYYLEALTQYEKVYGRRPIWLFTDSVDEREIAEFIDCLGVEKILNSNSLSTSETFELMRNGKAFIVANSSFSWWSATLAYEHQAPVFAPSPWFKRGNSPEQLLPTRWHKVDSIFE